MPCIESPLRLALALLTALVLAGCGSGTTAPPPAAPAAPSVAPPGGPAAAAPTSATPATPPSPAPATSPAGPAPARPLPLPPPTAARTWDDFKLQAAQRLVQAHPGASYLGPAPEPLLAIPVLEVELNADGSVRRVTVLRHPRQARDTTQLAIDAVHRAAPYGAMTRLPRPWKWTEVFLFDDQRRFKPRILDAG